jgi:Tfp pilus assembly protein PilF
MAISNLATVVDEHGKTIEANQMRERPASTVRRGQQAAFAVFNAGVKHMQEGNYAPAREAFARELARDPFNDEVNYWQARALIQLGDYRRAVLIYQRQSSTARPSRAGKYTRQSAPFSNCSLGKLADWCFRANAAMHARPIVAQ